MTITSDRQSWYALARRCRRAAMVLADQSGERIRLLELGNVGEAEVFAAADAGIRLSAGVIGISSSGLEACVSPGFEGAMLRAIEQLLSLEEVGTGPSGDGVDWLRNLWALPDDRN